jgi:hypothetical protein
MPGNVPMSWRLLSVSFRNLESWDQLLRPPADHALQLVSCASHAMPTRWACLMHIPVSVVSTGHSAHGAAQYPSCNATGKYRHTKRAPSTIPQFHEISKSTRLRGRREADGRAPVTLLTRRSVVSLLSIDQLPAMLPAYHAQQSNTCH